MTNAEEIAEIQKFIEETEEENVEATEDTPQEDNFWSAKNILEMSEVWGQGKASHCGTYQDAVRSLQLNCEGH